MSSPAVLPVTDADTIRTVSLRSEESVRAQTFTSFEDAHAIMLEWDALVAALNGSLYMTFAWCEVWWRHYSARRELRVVAVRSRDELVGVLPFFIDRLASQLPVEVIRMTEAKIIRFILQSGVVAFA